jgi:hypothetical protein
MVVQISQRKKVKKIQNGTKFSCLLCPWAVFFCLVLGLATVLQSHCKPGPFEKQFCMANTAISPSYITFQRNHHEDISHSRQMWIYKINICTLRQG